MVKILSDDGKEHSSVEEAKAWEKAQFSPARKIIFSGSSDDLVYIKNYNDIDIEEEFYLGQKFILKDTNGSGLIVRPHYNGTWAFSVDLLDEDVPIPNDWNFNIYLDEDTQYSVCLSIEVTAGTYFSAVECHDF
jgi:hypothetical protein